MKTMKLMMFALLVVIVASCTSKVDSLALLKGKEWQLKSLIANTETMTNPQELPLLIFSDSTANLYGSAGCNRIMGVYTADSKGKLTIELGGATMMFCPDMDFEDQYKKVLPMVKTYTITNNELTLRGDGNFLEIIYTLVDTTKRIGVAKDAHGCNTAAGYTWSELRKKCIRIFEEGVKFTAVEGQDQTLAAYVIFTEDSVKAEVFLPKQETSILLERSEQANGDFVWSQEADKTYSVLQKDGKYIIEQNGEIIYTEV